MSYAPLHPEGATIAIRCAEEDIHGIVNSYADREYGALLALLGSTNRLELSVNGGNAAENLGARVGTSVTVRW